MNTAMERIVRHISTTQYRFRCILLPCQLFSCVSVFLPVLSGHSSYAAVGIFGFAY